MSQKKETTSFPPEPASSVRVREAELESTAIRHGFCPEYGEELVDLMRHRDYHAYCLRVVSSADVLRTQFASVIDKETNETSENFRERKDVAESRRDSFVIQVKIEANKMLTQASKKFHTAWLMSTG